MARQILPLAGQIIGGMVGGPVGAAIGGAIGGLVGNAIDPQIIKGPKLGDGQVQTSAEGVFRPIVLGTGAVMGNIIHRGPEVIRTHRESQGKGSGPKVETERRYRTFAIRIAEGSIAGVLRIWMDEKLVYDIRPDSEIPAESVQFAEGFQLYLGDEDQLPDPDLEAYLGAGNVNAYRGTAYIVFANFDLTDYGDRIPQFRFEVTTGVTEVPLSRIPNIGFSATANHQGGIVANGFTEHEVTFATAPFNWQQYIDGGVLLWQPALLAESAINLGAETACRTQVIDVRGIVVADSGWMGDPAWQSQLNHNLAVNGKGHLSGQIVGFGAPSKGAMSASIGPPTSVWNQIALPSGVGLHKMRIYRSGREDFASTGGTVRIWMPNPELLPDAPYAYYGVDGVIGSDEGYFATMWGPDWINLPSGQIDLSSVIGFLHKRVNSEPSDYEASQLPDVVDGIVFAGEYTAADCIRTLMPVYMFDASEHDAGSGYRLNYVKRGGPVAATLTISDLVDEPEESVREDSLDRPKKLHLHFQSPTVGYAPAKATSLRTSPDAKVTGEVSFSVPVVFSDEDEAWQRAGVMHQVAWSEVAGTQELVLADSWLELVPTDNVGLVLRDQQRRLRITKVTHVDGTIKCEMIADRQSAYTSNLTGVPLPKPTPPPPSIVGSSVFAFLDIPALTDNNDRLLCYVAVSGQSPAWHGAVIQRSVDGGANYTDVMTVRQNTIMGELVDPVSDASQHYTDTTNVVRVQLYTDDEIQSLTQQQFLSEGGAFALENPDGTWEVMQYRDAEEDSNGEWVLSTLLRGRLNTETNAHVAGARFVLLDGVYAIDAETSMIGQDLTHRVVSLGTSPETAPTSTDTYTAQSQREWPVSHVISDGVQGGSLPVLVVPRHRFGTEDRPVRSVNWQGYRITASDGSNSAVAETISDTHTLDVSGWSAPVTVTVSQLNRFTGAGPTVSEDF